MKILYVSDNRCRGNFGCRATSTALSQLIGQDNEIVAHISGKYTNFAPGNMVVNRKWSAKKYSFLSSLNNWDRFAQVWYMYNRYIDKNRFFFGKHDFVSLDMDKSIDWLIKCLPANPHLKEFDLRQYEFDAMVINGEGSFIFSTPPWRESIIICILMYWALKLGKKVFFLNAMFSDDPNSNHNNNTIQLVHKILDKCEVVQVRERFSFNYAEKYFPGLKNLVEKPDALFTWYDLINDSFRITDGKYYIPFGKETDESYYDYDYSKPYILISGSSSSKQGKYKEQLVEAFVKLTTEIKQHYSGYRVYLIKPCDGDNFLDDIAEFTDTPLIPMETNIIIAGKIIANASLYFTGRYHPAILGSLGGTPCVFMDSNSHKTLSLQHLLGYDAPYEFSCIPSDSDIKKMIQKGDEYLLQGDDIRNDIKTRAYQLSIQAKTIVDLIK